MYVITFLSEFGNVYYESERSQISCDTSYRCGLQLYYFSSTDQVLPYPKTSTCKIEHIYLKTIIWYHDFCLIKQNKILTTNKGVMTV